MPGRRGSFSIAIIARDEEAALPRLLASLHPFVERGGDVLVVDTGSTDRTVEVARDGGCRVLVEPRRFESRLRSAEARAIQARWLRDGPQLVHAGQRLFHFGAAREHAGAHAREEFVLHVDGSDELLAFDVDALDALARSGTWGALRYPLRVGGASLVVSRFHDRRLLAWRGRTHEVPLPRGSSVGRSGDAAPHLEVRHHGGPKQRTHYLPGLCLDALADPGLPRWLHYLGRELLGAGCPRHALRPLLRHAGSSRAGAGERSLSLVLAATCHVALGDTAAAAAALREAAVVDPTRRDPLLRLAYLELRRGDLEAAADLALRSLAVPRSSWFVEPDANYSWAPHHVLYWTSFWRGRLHDARVHWDECRRLAPDDPRFLADARLFRERAARSTESPLAGVTLSP